MSLDISRVPQVGSDRILTLIKGRGALRIADIAQALKITAEATRQQVLNLANRGLIVASTNAVNRGRPAHVWSLTDAGNARFPDRHAEVTVQLIDAIRTTLGDPALDALISLREIESERSYASALDGARTLATKVKRLAGARTREGYMAESVPIDGGFLLIENHCPICAAATVCQSFCRSELDIFRRVLGSNVRAERVEHILAGARRCAYRITPTEAK